MRKRFNITLQLLVEEFFDKRKTQKLIAFELGCDVTTVERAMKKFGLTNQITSRYKVREELMTPENPYFMYTVGLFITDGSISKGGRLSIRINDGDVIKVLCSYFDCPYYMCRRDNPTALHEFNVPYSTPLTVYCQALSDNSSKKTFDVSCPTNLKTREQKLMLLRGIIDGDGAIRPDLRDIRVFTASENMVITLSQILNDLNIVFTVQNTIYGRHKKDGWTIYIGTTASVSTLISVYEDYPDLAIQRKRNVVKNRVQGIVRDYKMINLQRWG